MPNLKKEIETYIKSVDETGRGIEVDVGAKGIETTSSMITVRMFPEIPSPGCDANVGTAKAYLCTHVNDYLNCGTPSDCRTGHCTDFNSVPNCNIFTANGKIWGSISNGVHSLGAEVHTYLQNFEAEMKNPDDATINDFSAEQDPVDPLKYNVDGSYTLAEGCVTGSLLVITFQSVETFCYDHGFPDNGMSTMDRQCTTFIPCECPEPLPAMTWIGTDTITTSVPKSFSISGGVSPYSWSSNKGSFSLPNPVSGTSNVLDAGGECGSISVTVNDSCGQSVQQYIRVTDNGQWDTAVLCGGFPGSGGISCSNRCLNPLLTYYIGRYKWRVGWSWTINDIRNCNTLIGCGYVYACPPPISVPYVCSGTHIYCGIRSTEQSEWIC